MRDAIIETRPERAALGVVVVRAAGQRDAHRYDVVCSEAGVNRLQFPERAQHQSTADQQNQRHRQFADNERSAKQLRAAGSGGAAGGVLQRAGDAADQQRHKGSQTEEGASDDAGDQSEDQYAHVHHDFVGSRNAAGVSELHETNSAVGKREAEGGAAQRQQNSFGDELSCQTRKTRAHRSSDGDLATPRFSTREQQVRHVDTGDQQYEHYCAQQHQQRGPDTRYDLGMQRKAN